MKKKTSLLLILVCVATLLSPQDVSASITIKHLIGLAKTNLNRYFRTTVTELQDSDYASSPNPVPIAYYKFDEANGATTAASSVGGTTCTQVTASGGSIAHGYTGIASNAILQTSGTARTYYSCGTGTGDIDGGTAVTVSAWVRRTNTNDGVIVGKESGSGARGGYIMYITGNKVLFRVRNSVSTATSYTATAATIPSNDSAWTHIVGQWQPNSISIWVDGVEYSSAVGAITSIGSTSGTPLTIGAAALGSPTSSLGGYIDDVRVYNTYLSSTDIANLYAYRGPQNVQVTTTATTTRTVKPNAPQNRKVSSGLVGLWTFDGQDISSGRLTDRGSLGNNANFYNIASSTFFSIGKIGQAGNFDGVDDYAKGGTTGLPTGTSARSIGGWLKVSDTSSVKVPFVYGACTLGSDAFGVYLDATETLNFWGCGDGDFSTGTTVTTDMWHHVMATYDGTNVKVYLDGVQVGATTARTLTIGTTAWNVGSATGLDAANYYYKGKADDVRIYNRALTAIEVVQLYSLGR